MKDQSPQRRVHSSELFSVRVGELPENVQEQELRDAFDRWGKIGDVWIPKDHDTGRTRGFAFVRYYKRDDRDDCLESVASKPVLLRDQQVTVSYAKQQTRSSPPPSNRYSRDSRDRRHSHSSRSRRDRSESPRRRRSRSPARRRRKSRSRSPRESRRR